MTDYEKNINAAFLLTGYGLGVINHALSFAETMREHCDLEKVLLDAKEYYERVLSETIYKVKDRL